MKLFIRLIVGMCILHQSSSMCGGKPELSKEDFTPLVQGNNDDLQKLARTGKCVGGQLAGLNVSEAIQQYQRKRNETFALKRILMRKSIKLKKANLEGANLSNLELKRANFKKAKLKEANFSSTKLHKVNCKKADATKADFAQAELKKIDGRYMNVAETEWTKAKVKSFYFKIEDSFKVHEAWRPYIKNPYIKKVSLAKILLLI